MNNPFSSQQITSQSRTATSPGAHERKLGQILTAQGVLTEEGLEWALDEQKRNRSRRFGDFLVEKREVTREQLEETLQKTARNSRFPQDTRIGEILVGTGLISRETLKDNLRDHEKKKQEKVGSLLIDSRLVAEEQVLRALSQKLDVPFVNLEEKSPPPTAVRSLSRHLATKMAVVPVDLQGRTLVVATTDPTDLIAEKYLSFNTGYSIKMVLATSRQIREAQQKIYDGGKFKVDELIREMTDEVEVIDDDFEVNLVKETDSAVIKLVNKILLASVSERASDIHFEPGPGKADMAIRFRVDGECHLAFDIPANYKRAVLSRLKILASLDISERRKPQSGKILLKSGEKKLEFRVEITPTSGGLEDAVLRVVANAKPIPLHELGFSKTNLEKFKRLLTKPYGIILCVGPTGSGKTTSLHSALSYINAPNRKIWTAEDPVEITQPGLRQVQINPKTGLTFSEALRSFLRADPDVIMVGEMRDPETAKMAIDASLTGHLVFSTLHTNNAAETVNRLLQIGLDPLHFADALLGILAQRLVLKLCEHCKQPYHPEREEYDKLIGDYGPALAQIDGLPEYSDDLTLMRKTGCPKCNGTGYFGRMGIHELLLGSEQLKQLIANRRAAAEVRYLAIKDGGMRPLRMDGIQKVFQGLTDYAQILRVCI